MLPWLLVPLLSAAPINPIDESLVVPVQEPISPAFIETPPTPPEDPPTVEENLAEQSPMQTPGSQLGFISFAALDVTVKMQSPFRPLVGSSREAKVTDAGGTFALGVRYGLKERILDRQWMPALGFVIGTSVTANEISPFTEVRAEWLTVSPGGPLQPNFVVYGSSGVTLSTGFGNPLALNPHVGFGLGWNWLPKGGGGGGWGSGWSSVVDAAGKLKSTGGGGGGWGSGWSGSGLGGGAGLLLAIPVALAAGLMIFAGRLEVRYVARPFLGPGNDYFALMIGAGT